MKLVFSTNFERAYKKYIKRFPAEKEKIQNAITKMQENIYQESLSTHRLSGKLKDLYACSCGYDCRILFSFERINEEVHLLLIDIGTHLDVY